MTGKLRGRCLQLLLCLVSETIETFSPDFCWFCTALMQKNFKFNGILRFICSHMGICSCKCNFLRQAVNLTHSF